MLHPLTVRVKRATRVAEIYSVSAFLFLLWPPLLFVMLFVIAWRKAPGRNNRRLTTLGSARWADADDLRHSGMLGASSGLILGRLPRRNELVRLPNIVHTVAFVPTGGGKGVSLVIPTLLTDERSQVVMDYKGENAVLTAEHRRKTFGHRIVILDPYHKLTQTPDTFNPCDFIRADDPLALDDCNDLANALVVRTHEEKEPHWNDSAESYIAGVIATVVAYGEADTRSLLAVREILSHPQKLEMAIKLMTESDRWGGALAPMGGQLMHFTDKEKSSVLSSALRHLRFLGSPAVAQSTAKSTFDPAELRTGRMTVYLVLPPRPSASSGRPAEDVGRVIDAGMRSRRPAMKEVQFVLDESAMLGTMDAINDAVGIGRGYGIRLQFYYQSMGQLRHCFPDGQEHTLLSNATQIFFGVNDNATASYVSDRLGEETIILESGGKSSGGSRQYTHGAHPSDGGGSSWNENRNWQQQTRRLLKPEEVMALPARSAITFAPGTPPILTELLRYYEEPGLRGTGVEQRRGRLGEWVGVVRATLWFALILAAAIWITYALHRLGPGVLVRERAPRQQHNVQGVENVSGTSKATVRRPQGD